ncbi:MAG: Mov34/MPN/PAD-1 family protein [Planctomycetes bacterium]|nr:Mov34/MPN/PAD-1 family protein [Planctomycetota bacterium]
MDAAVVSQYGYRLELWSAPDGAWRRLKTRDATPDVADLVEEALVSGVLSEELPLEPDALAAEVLPVFSADPFVAEIEVRLEARLNGHARTISRRFAEGPWVRAALRDAALLRQGGGVRKDETVYRLLAAEAAAPEAASSVLALDAPRIAEHTLADLGVRGLGAGALDPERPILVHRRLVNEVLEWTREAGKAETGGALFGRLARLPAPLPGARTRVVTVLSAALRDARHAGAASSFDFSPAALLAAAEVAEERGAGESVLAVFHSHGWLAECASCAADAGKDHACALPECEPSLQDYVLLESLFPGKAALLPIAGRRPAGASQRLAFEVFAWRLGALRALPWQDYD